MPILQEIQQGDQGTVLFKDLVLVPGSNTFNSGTGINQSSVLQVLTFNLPGALANGFAPSYRVVVELTGQIVTNQIITSTIAYLGIGTTYKGTNSSGSFAGYINPPQGASIINNVSCVADGLTTVSTVTSGGINTVVRYIGTYNSLAPLNFSVLAAAVSPDNTFYVDALLTLTAYPLYN
jgi:hypothetical protein